jgi:hypothetical protein
VSRADVQSVYIARGLASGLLKIGRTLRLRSRLKALATKSGEPVETLAVIVTGGLYENALHRQFAAQRTAPERGREWYADDGAIRAFVEALPAHQRAAHRATPGVLGSRPRLTSEAA